MTARGECLLTFCVNMLKFKVLCFDGHMALKGVCEYFEI